MCAYPYDKQIRAWRSESIYEDRKKTLNDQETLNDGVCVWKFEGTGKNKSVVKRFFVLSSCCCWSAGEKSPCPARGEDALIADQFEVSECTLPGPSVGDITEDGVVASCHPPLAWNTEGEKVEITNTFSAT